MTGPGNDYGVLDARELAWAAGLFEGEGNTCLGRGGKGSHIVAQLQMTDEDTVARFFEAIGRLGTVRSYQPSQTKKDGSPRKRLYQWQAYGFEKVQAIVALLWFGLGQRRRAQAKHALEQVREYKRRRDALGRWC